MKRILLDNALESWSMAVKYCYDLKNGLATLHYQKAFVSSLHNSIELFLKQIMLDSNDHSVACLSKVKDETDAILQLEYFRSQNLNEFFSSLSSDNRNKFYSIEFSKLTDISTSLIKNTLNELSISSIKEELKLLQRLRNNETHFYISKSDYLSEQSFVTLYNLMVTMYEVITRCDFLPYWGEPLKEYKHLEFSSKKISSFSYYDALRSSQIAKSVIEVLDGTQMAWFNDSPYDLAERFFDENENTDFSFKNVLTIITMMKQYDCITYTQIEISEECDIGDGIIAPPQIVYNVNFKL